jgi:hypothetical protein
MFALLPLPIFRSFYFEQRFNDIFYQIKYFGWSEREQKIRKLAKVIDEFVDDLISKSRAKHDDLVDPSKGHQSSDIVRRFLQQAKKNDGENTVQLCQNLYYRSLFISMYFISKSAHTLEIW